MVESEGLQVADGVALGKLRRELGAELRLAARPLDEEHQLACHRERHLAAVVLLDHREGQVHPGAHTSRGVHAAIANEDPVRLHAHLGVLGREPGAEAPVRRGAPPVQDPGPCQQERPRADRAEAAHAALRGAEPRVHIPVVQELPDALAARHEQGVDRIAEP